MTNRPNQPSDDPPGAPGPDPIGPVGCRPSLEDLYRYMDGFLDEQRIADVGSHLRACGGCGDVHRFETGFRHLIETRCRTELPPDLRDRVLRAITDLR